MITLLNYLLDILLCFDMIISFSHCNPLDSNIWDSVTKNHNDIHPDTSLISLPKSLLSSSSEPLTSFQKYQYTKKNNNNNNNNNSENTNIPTNLLDKFNIRRTITLTKNDYHTFASSYDSDISDYMTRKISPNTSLCTEASSLITNSLSKTSLMSTSIRNDDTVETNIIFNTKYSTYSGPTSYISYEITDLYTISQYVIDSSSMETTPITSVVSSNTKGTQYLVNILDKSSSITFLSIKTIDLISNTELLSLPSMVHVASNNFKSLNKHSPTCSKNNIQIQTMTSFTKNVHSMILTKINGNINYINSDNDISFMTTNKKNKHVSIENIPSQLFILNHTTASFLRIGISSTIVITQLSVSKDSCDRREKVNCNEHSNINQEIQIRNQVSRNNPTISVIPSTIYDYNGSSRYISLSSIKPKNVRTNLVNNTMTTSINSYLTNTTKLILSLRSTRTFGMRCSKISNGPYFSTLINNQDNIFTPTTTMSKSTFDETDKLDFDHNNHRSRWLPKSIKYDTATDTVTTFNQASLSDLPAVITPYHSVETPLGYEIVTIGFQSKLNYAFLVSNPLATAQVFDFLPRTLYHPILYYLKQTNPNLQIYSGYKMTYISNSDTDMCINESINVTSSNICITWPLSMGGSTSFTTPLDTIMRKNYILKNSSLTLNFSNFKVKKIYPYIIPNNDHITSLAEVYVPKNYTSILQRLITNTTSVLYNNSKENLRTLANLIDNSLPISDPSQGISYVPGTNSENEILDISNFINDATLDNMEVSGPTKITSGGIDYSLTDNRNIDYQSKDKVVIFIFCLTTVVFIWIYSLLQISTLLYKKQT